MKYSGMPVNPQHSVSWSACILSLSSEIKNTAQEQKMAEAEITRLWCVHKVGSRCTHLGAGLLQEQWFLKGEYLSCYVGNGIWHVMEQVYATDIEPKIEDVCVTWLTIYKMFAFGSHNSDNERIDFALQNILKQNISGPQLHAAIPVFLGCNNLSP